MAHMNGYTMDIYLVGLEPWNFIQFYDFPFSWEESSQLTNIFSEGLKPPTSNVWRRIYKNVNKICNVKPG